MDSPQTPSPEHARVEWQTPRIEEAGCLAEAENNIEAPFNYTDGSGDCS
jgi:hypothetical protein